MTDPTPRRILALDGGGIRGVITLAFLERLEELLGKPLARHFDLIGGTSTGAIIASGLALGMPARRLTKFYFELGPDVFKRRMAYVPGLMAKYRWERLHRRLGEIIGARTLNSPDLLTGIAIFAKRLDTGSPWIVTNNPKAKYWEAQDGSYEANKNYALIDLVRASTAAPSFFHPQRIQVVRGLSPGLFVDGGTTPFNNPALALAMVALIPAYGYNWESGADNLRITSIGAGGFRVTETSENSWRLPLGLAIKVLRGLIRDGEMHALAMMQWLGETDTPWEINSEIGDLSTAPKPGRPLFHFRRYELMLEEATLEALTGRKFSSREVEALREIDAVREMQKLYDFATLAAKQQIKPQHLD